MLVGKGQARVEKMGYGGAESVSFFFLKKNYLSETRESILSGDRSLSVGFETSSDQ